jgi:hypothetical protein
MAQVFISHIHEEKDVAEAVLRFLREFDLKAFLSSDHWQIRAGERWFDRITAELTEAKVVILLLSERSVTRPWINFEAGWAWATKKATIPACFGELTKGKMPRPYSDLQGLDLLSDYYDLLKDCYSYVQMDKMTPPPLPAKSPAVVRLINEVDAFLKRP